MSCENFVWTAVKIASGTVALIAIAPILGPVGVVSTAGSAVAVATGIGGAAIDTSRDRR
jgi:hypothetical protein